MTVQTQNSDIIADFRPFDLEKDETFLKLDPVAQKSNQRMIQLAREKLKLTVMIDPNDEGTVLVHEDGRYMTGCVGYNFVGVYLWDDFDNGFARDDFPTMSKYLTAVGERFDRLCTIYHSELI